MSSLIDSSLQKEYSDRSHNRLVLLFSRWHLRLKRRDLEGVAEGKRKRAGDSHDIPLCSVHSMLGSGLTHDATFPIGLPQEGRWGQGE